MPIKTALEVAREWLRIRRCRHCGLIASEVRQDMDLGGIGCAHHLGTFAELDEGVQELLLESREREAVEAHIGRLFPIQRSTSVPWAEAERAYRQYSKLHGNDQSLERLAERGGFGVEEFACLWWGHDPFRCKIEKHECSPLTRQEIEAALKVCEKATPGPWVHHHKYSTRVCDGRHASEDGCSTLAEAEIIGMPRQSALFNAAFIAVARTLLPKALRALLERHEDSEFMTWLERTAPNTLKTWREAYSARTKEPYAE